MKQLKYLWWWDTYVITSFLPQPALKLFPVFNIDLVESCICKYNNRDEKMESMLMALDTHMSKHLVAYYLVMNMTIPHGLPLEQPYVCICNEEYVLYRGDRWLIHTINNNTFIYQGDKNDHGIQIHEKLYPLLQEKSDPEYIKSIMCINSRLLDDHMDTIHEQKHQLDKHIPSNTSTILCKRSNKCPPIDPKQLSEYIRTNLVKCNVSLYSISIKQLAKQYSQVLDRKITLNVLTTALQASGFCKKRTVNSTVLDGWANPK
uniref:Uncharacterized protein n=1 Tax=Megaviridae environmental sample TaxID=1737588 RepID=A0A5J6VKY5_9VIRU|nr:MAG: hypothetical protein [Megaviridae environmental sample]